MTIDSISNMATIIWNAISIKNSLVTLPYTKNNEVIAKILAKEGFIHCVTTTNKTHFGFTQSDSMKFSNTESFQEPTLSISSLANWESEPKKNEKINTTHSNNLAIKTSVAETNNPSLNQNRTPEISDSWEHFGNSTQEINKNVKKKTSGSDISTKHETTREPNSINEKEKVNFENPRFSKISSELKSNRNNQKVIILALKYIGREKKTIIHAIKRISKPSLRWYCPNPVPQSLGGLGIFIISTSFGIVTDKEAWDKKIGGEILLEIW